MNTKLVTTIFIITVAVLLILWDIFVASNKIPGDTISEIMLAQALRHPIIPFGIGVLCGHLFWSQQ